MATSGQPTGPTRPAKTSQQRAEMASPSGTRVCDLPNEMLLYIFSFLPVADLARCAATTDHWHRIVAGSTHLWKGKRYVSNRSPRECTETHAVLQALPPFREVIVDLADSFLVDISYPRVLLSVKYIGAVRDCPKLRCDYLSSRLDILGDILASRSTVDFEGLRHLQIVHTWTLEPWVPCAYSADYVVRAALSLCSSLRHLSVRAYFLSAEYLGSVKGFGQLQTLQLVSPSLQKLSFLRHCSAALEELQLLGCSGLPPHELAELRYLRRLRRLRLGDCRLTEGDLAAAVLGLASLESLQLDRCSLVRDLSVLQRCALLRQLCIVNSPVPDPLTPGGRRLRLRDLRLPAAPAVDARTVGVAVIAHNLPGALSRLEEWGLTSSSRAYLAALSQCPLLQHLCCEFTRAPTESDLFNVRVDITLTSSRPRTPYLQDIGGI